MTHKCLSDLAGTLANTWSKVRCKGKDDLSQGLLDSQVAACEERSSMDHNYTLCLTGGTPKKTL